MSAPNTVLATLVIYQVVLLGIGFWARSRSTSTTDFFLGGRNLGPLVTALSYAAGSSSAWSILGVSGIAFSQGLSAVWLIPGTLLGHLVVWFWIAPKLHDLSHGESHLTLTDVLAKSLGRYALLTYRLSALVILFCFTFYIAAQFQGAANTLTAAFNFDFVTALLVGAVVVLVYTVTGGFWAVSLTDALQAALMLLAAIILPLAAWQAIGGIDGLTAHIATTAAHATPEASWAQFNGGYGGYLLVGFMLGTMSIGFGPIGQPHLLNRIMAMKNRHDIALARGVALAWFVLVLSGMFLLGVCGHILLTGAQDSEGIFFVLADQLLPAVLTGVLIAAVLSAIMSTADSQLLVAGAALHHDMAGGQSGLAADGFTGRPAVIGVCIASVLLALYLPESIFARVLFAWNALGAAFGPALIARLMGAQVKPIAVPLAIALGFILTVVFYSLPNGPGDLWERFVPFLCGAVTLWWARTSR